MVFDIKGISGALRRIQPPEFASGGEKGVALIGGKKARAGEDEVANRSWRDICLRRIAVKAQGAAHKYCSKRDICALYGRANFIKT